MKRSSTCVTSTTLAAALLAPALCLSGTEVGGSHIRNLVARSWQLEEGLPQNHVPAIVQTPDGFLWVGTQEGVARFDGVQFKLFSAANMPAFRQNRVYAMSAGRGDSLWIGTLDGLIRYRDGAFTTLTSADGLAHDMVQALCSCPAGVLWVGTREGLSCVVDGRVHRCPEEVQAVDTNITALAFDETSRAMWIGTYKEGLLRYAEGELRSFTVADGLPSEQIAALEMGSDGELWVGTRGGLARYSAGKFYTYTMKDGLPGDQVQSLFEDTDGSLWVGTSSAGLAHLVGDRFTVFSQQDGLSENGVLSILRDREGNLWVGTAGGGLDRLQDYGLTLYTTRDGLSNNIIAPVLEDHAGRMWVGTWEDGLNVLENGTFRTYTTRDGLPDNAIQALFEDRQHVLWVGTEAGGMARLEGARFKAITTADGLGHNNVRAILEDRSGALWVGTYGGGVTVIRDGRFSTMTSRDGLISDYVVTLFEDRDGAVWVGTDGAGLSRVAGSGFTNYGQETGLVGAYVRVIVQDEDGTLWVGTSGGGLFRFREGRFTVYTDRQGLWSNKIFHIFQRGEELWLTCNRGIFRVRKQSFDELDRGAISRLPCDVFGREPGLGNLECNGGYKPAGWTRNDGTFWFGTISGMAVLDPSRVDLTHVAPPAFIEGLLADRRSVELGSEVKIPPSVQRLSFQYIGLDYTSPRAVSYNYMLEGLDREWIDAGSGREVTYSHLRPGRYRFLVKACVGERCTSQPAELSLVVAAPFWRTSWFLTGMVLALGGGVYSVGRWRQHVKQRREAERAELVRSLTVGMLHELRQPLQVVQSRLEVLELRPELAQAVLAEVFGQMGKLRSILAQLDELQQEGSAIRTTSYAGVDSMVDLSPAPKEPEATK